MTFQRLSLARHLMNGMAKRSRKGFTLIELLVVVVIIGILASVALPSFVGAQDKARNASVQSNGRTVQMALEEFGTEHNGAYPPTAAGWSTAGADQFTGTGTSYLPGAAIPKSPWLPASGSPQANAIAAAGAAVATHSTTVAAAYASAVNTVAATPSNPGGMNRSNDLINATGVIPGAYTSPAEYGIINYDYHPATQYYVLYATGKKGKTAICVSAISNAGN